MNKTSWLLILLAIIWVVVSWNWYTCGIKGFCAEEAIPAVVVEEEIDEEQFGFADDSPAPEPAAAPIEVAQAEPAPTCAAYLTKFIKFDTPNDPKEVQKLKRFLDEYENANITDFSGTYDEVTMNAVKTFQNKYSKDVLEGPWGIAQATGYVYKSTLAKINELYCAKTRVGSE